MRAHAIRCLLNQCVITQNQFERITALHEKYCKRFLLTIMKSKFFDITTRACAVSQDPLYSEGDPGRVDQ